MKYTLVILGFLFSFCGFSQELNTNYKTKKLVVKDSVLIDSVSINSSRFLVKTKEGVPIDTSYYRIDFVKALLVFKKPVATDSIIVDYLKYPDFLTNTYQELNESIIVENTSNLERVYRLAQPSENRQFIPFDGLTTSGSITRGVTIGNNQNSVLNSELDLQIVGKLNDKVSLRASIQDANIPLQESGYSQRLDEFDQVFIELFTDTWNIRAGDIDLGNNSSYFAQFSKRVQGLSINSKFGGDQNNEIFAAGALVRGQFSRSRFIGQEGNQGPYKLQGTNGELYVLIVSGSERVSVNGVVLERGENKDYIIDYNAGEIIFNPTFPITSEMRITVDYQFSDKNYSRFLGYGGGKYEGEKLKIGASVYSENDLKNQPLQQNLSTDQVTILSGAGDDSNLMIAPSAVQESFNENRILYKKELINGIEAFVFSNNPDDELYNVRFSNVGENQGNYIVSSVSAITNIFEYVEPVGGVAQGSYEPIVQLIAPVKLQMAVINGVYDPTEKTSIDFELSASKNDLNLFSNLDDNDNNGYAGKLRVNHKIVKNDSLWNFEVFAQGDFIHENFRTIEPLYNFEFARDWNLQEVTGNQNLLISGLNLLHPSKGIFTYKFEHLNYSNSFNGNKHSALADLRFNSLSLFSNTSILNTNATLFNSTFMRSFNRVVYDFNNAWVGSKLAIENNEQKNKLTQELNPISQKFSAYEVFTGVGDSTKIFVELGYKHRVNDSIRNNTLQRVNTSNTYYLKSKLVQTTNTNLGVFVNYRTLKNKDANEENERSLNSRLQYSQKLFRQVLQLNTIFDTNSGTLPQQEFTYVEVEPGRGAYTWIDYNNNGIQELEEFEIAQFQDQGTFIRVLLPNQIFIRTHQNRLSQTLTINPSILTASSEKTTFWNRLYNQASYLIDRKIRRNGNNFNLNPFEGDAEDQLGLQLNFRNVLFYNRGKQKYTTSYTFINNKTQSVLSFGFIENYLNSHQIDFNHKIANTWLMTLESVFQNSESVSENFASKNFKIDETRFNPKISYLFSDNSRFDVFYNYSMKENTIGDQESLKQNKYGISFSTANTDKAAINAEFNYLSNNFAGNANSPVGYQMMEGLQPGNNFTWSLLAQKKLTKFLDLNLNYFGRKSETSKTIHTGTVQLRAYF